MKKIFKIILLVLGLYVGVVSIVQAFKCDKLTRTQLTKELPNNLLLKFKEC